MEINEIENKNNTQKQLKPKTDSFKRATKLTNLLARMTKKKREMTHFTKIRIGSGDININLQK